MQGKNRRIKGFGEAKKIITKNIGKDVMVKI